MYTWTLTIFLSLDMSWGLFFKSETHWTVFVGLDEGRPCCLKADLRRVVGGVITVKSFGDTGEVLCKGCLRGCCWLWSGLDRKWNIWPEVDPGGLKGCGWLSGLDPSADSHGVDSAELEYGFVEGLLSEVAKGQRSIRFSLKRYSYMIWWLWWWGYSG